MKGIYTLVLLFFMASPMSSYSDTSFANEDINTIGSHDGNTMFLTVKSNDLANMGCNYSVVYCPDTRATCKSMLGLAIVAKSTSGKVDLVVAKDASNICTLQMMVLK